MISQAQPDGHGIDPYHPDLAQPELREVLSQVTSLALSSPASHEE